MFSERIQSYYVQDLMVGVLRIRTYMIDSCNNERPNPGTGIGGAITQRLGCA